MNKQIVKQLIDIVLFLKSDYGFDERFTGGGPGVANIKPIHRQPGHDPVGWKNQPIVPEGREQGDITVIDPSGGKKVIPASKMPDASREKSERQYNPQGRHRGERGAPYDKLGEREVGGVQVDVVTAPKAKKPGKPTDEYSTAPPYEPEAEGITVKYQSASGMGTAQQLTGITDPEAAKEEFIRRHSNNPNYQDDTLPMKDNSEGFSLKDKNGDWLQYNDIVKSVPFSNEEKVINTIDFYIQQR